MGRPLYPMLSSRAMFFGPFMILYGIGFLLLLLFVFVLEIGLIHHAFQMIGLSPEAAFLGLLASLAGSYINIPIRRIDGGVRHEADTVHFFGVRYRVPTHPSSGHTTLAVNVGGAVVPVVISIYILMNQPGTIIPAGLGVLIVSLVVHRFARPIRGLGIATPMLVPPIVAAIAASLLSGLFAQGIHVDAIAYVSGVMGTLIGADIANLDKLGDLGAPVASIGGAGTFDGVFLTGIVAVLLA
jgi:uncharacterized membrane protein